MEFREAGQQIIPFGKYDGQTIDAVAKRDEGLSYLDWLLGQNWVFDDLKTALRVYLNDPAIKKELKAIIDADQAD